MIKSLLRNLKGFVFITTNALKTRSQGFTLIELMVVISIIAILALIGIVLFSNTQKAARDTRRRADVDSVANALETNRTPGATTYNVLAGSQFNSGNIPADPGANGTAIYCAAASTTSTTPPTQPTTWTSASVGGCPSAPAGFAAISTTNPGATSLSWIVCALLETTTTPQWYCKSSAR